MIEGNTMDLYVDNLKNTYLLLDTDNDYFLEFSDALHSLYPYMTNKQKKNLLKDFQITGSVFNEAKYLQAACETSIASYVAKIYGHNFSYEPKINPPKDVDCSFKSNGNTYNIEVKCPDYSKKNRIDNSDSFKIGAFGRPIDFDEVFLKLNEAFELTKNMTPEFNKSLIKQHHMDNNLKDYLLSAHSKFNDLTSSSELNVLAICCADVNDMQKWFFYMYGYQGLFTSETFHSYKEYRNVDVVVLTNLYHRHYNYSTKDKIKDHWDFSKSFNLIFSNPLRLKDKKEIIYEFIDLIPNHSKRLMNYKVKNGLDEMRISHYVNEELLEKSLYYFQPNANKS